MTSIPPVTNPTAGGGATPPASAMSGLAANENMFLKMLTTQMQNQDPLNPMDTTQYTQQLTQFSQVEQTIQQTSTLKDILARLDTQDMSQASGFIGRDARFGSATAGLMGSAPAQWEYSADRPLASVTAKVADASGAVIDTREISPGSTNGRFVWDGKRSDGSQAPDGAYSVTMSGSDSAGSAVPVTARSAGTVKDVMNVGGVVTLGVNGIRIPATMLLGLAQAG